METDEPWGLNPFVVREVSEQQYQDGCVVADCLNPFVVREVSEPLSVTLSLPLGLS